MPLCESFEKLTITEKKDYIGSLVHITQFDEESYKNGCDMINKALTKGVLSGIRFDINPSDAPMEYTNEKPVTGEAI